MRAVSLFSGCLGLDLGAESAGVETVCYVESEPACQALIRERRPGVRILDDVRGIDHLIADELGDVDLVIGGFPCQDLSYAGRGAGLSGERSGLWFEMLRIVELLEPGVVLIENVPALLSRGLGVVLHGLARAGYSGYWFTLAAAHVGAPHLRVRVFVLASLSCEFSGGQPAGRMDNAGWLPLQESLFGLEPMAKFGRRGRFTATAIYEDPEPDRETEVVLLPTPQSSESTPTDEFLDEISDVGIDPEARLYLPGRKWHVQRTLSRVIPALLPTPRGSDANGSGEHGDGGLDLRTAAGRLLPTPVANPENPGTGGELRAALEHGPDRRNGTGVDSMGRANEGRPSRLLPTPQARDDHGPQGASYRGDSVSDLPSAIQQLDPDSSPYLLPTPTTQDAANTGGPSQAERNSEPLNSLAPKLMPTPTVRDHHAQGAGGILARRRRSSRRSSRRTRGCCRRRSRLLEAIGLRRRVRLAAATSSGRSGSCCRRRSSRIPTGPRRSTARTDEWESNEGTSLTDAIWETQGRETDTLGALLPTATATDARPGRTTHAGGNLTLQGALTGPTETDLERHVEAGRLMPTPQAHDAGAGQASRADRSCAEAGFSNLNDQMAALAEAEAGSSWGVYAAAVERWERICGRPAPAPTDDRGRLSPEFVEWMLGFPDGWTALDGARRTQRLKMLGNAVQVQVAETVAALLPGLL